MADSLETESAAALLSMKDGALNNNTQKHLAVLSRPPRIRKRNRRIFNDFEDTSYTLSRSSGRKSARTASPVPQKTDDPEWTPDKRPGRSIKKEPMAPAVLPDKRVIQKVGIRLRNLLKLPKAHRWVCYEWFYSNIDQPLFLGDNEFCGYLKQSFPLLKTRKLTRVQWCKIRRIMGKPRRCSPAFFEEEIRALHDRRNSIRQVQQRRTVSIENYGGLPDDIPLPLVIGTKVTARLRKPQDGLFEGSIDAVDTQTATYRTKFDRSGLGTHSVPDYEVLSLDPPETMPKSSFLQRQRPRQVFYLSPPRNLYPQGHQLENDPLLGASPLRSGLTVTDDASTVGGFPVEFLTQMVQLSKILSVKRQKIDKLRDMNSQAERMTSYRMVVRPEFKKRYAALIMEFEVLNEDLQDTLEGIMTYCERLAPEQGLQFDMQPQAVRSKCLAEARELMRSCAPPGGSMAAALAASGSSPQESSSEAAETAARAVDLVAKLTSLMLQIKNLAQGDLNSFELQSLSEALVEVQGGLDSRNVALFENKVQIHVNHIQNGLSQLGSLYAFTSSSHNVAV